MGHVFISYSRRDTETVEKIVARLETEGIEAWIDREDIVPGKQWRKQIVEGIDTADAFILHLSPDSGASRNVLKELNLAEEALDPYVLPIKLKDMPIPDEMRYQLAGDQFAAYYLDSDKAVREVIAEIKKRQGHLSEKPIKPPAFREIEIVLENETKESFSEKAKEKLLEALGDILKDTVVDLTKDFIITRIEEVIEPA
jgi:TIR domain